MEKTERIEIRTSKDVKEKIEKKAEKQGMSISAFVIECCTQESKHRTDAKGRRKVLNLIVEVQDNMNQLKQEQQLLALAVEQMEQEVSNLWQFLK